MITCLLLHLDNIRELSDHVEKHVRDKSTRDILKYRNLAPKMQFDFHYIEHRKKGRKRGDMEEREEEEGEEEIGRKGKWKKKRR